MEEFPFPLTNIAGIVMATMFLVMMLKGWIGVTPYLKAVPLWLYAVLISGALHLIAATVLHTMPLDWNVTWQTVIAAALASGFREWYQAINKPAAESTAARLKQLMMGAVLILILPMYGCVTAGGPVKTHGPADILNDAVATSLAAMQDQEKTDYQLGYVDAETHKAFNAQMVVALKTGRALNAAIGSWQPGQPLPNEVKTLTMAIGDLVKACALKLPDSNPAKAHILVYTNAVQAAVIAFLDSLAQQGV